MSLIAAGAYLRTLREAHELSRAKVATLASTHESQIERIERGGGETRASLLLSFAQVVQADLNDLALLILDTNATAEDGLQAAEQHFKAQEQDETFALAVQGIEDSAFVRLMEEIRTTLAEDPKPSNDALIDALRTFVAGWRARSRQG